MLWILNREWTLMGKDFSQPLRLRWGGGEKGELYVAGISLSQTSPAGPSSEAVVNHANYLGAKLAKGTAFL
jgi:hypothetical protein